MRKVLIVFALAFILILPAIARADLNYGLVAYYSFNNCDATDDSGNGHDGTIYGNPQCVGGKIGKAFYFDGKDDYIDTNTTENIFIGDNPSEWSFTLWVKVGDLKGWQKILGPNTDTSQWAIYFYISETQFGIHLCSNHNPKHLNVYKKFPSGWHLVTGVISKDGYARLYIDGNLEKQLSIDKNNDYSNNTNIYLGAQNLSRSPGFFNGYLDEVRIYNRALSESEIKELYEQGLNNCSGGGYTEADLQKKYSEGFEAGKEYCKKNPSACGITVSSSTDCSSEYQSGYNNGYNKGYEDGKNSCSGTSQENPFLPPTTSSQCATFDFVSNIFSVPCFETGKSTYSLDFKLINTKPVQLELINVKKK